MPMANEEGVPDLSLPGAVAAFTRLRAEVDLPVVAAVPDVDSQERARSVAFAMVTALAVGQPWDDAWSSGEDAVPDADLATALLELTAVLLHHGADRTDTDPLEFLREALDAS